MKFFISLIIAIIQANLCQSYYQINHLVMLTGGQNINLENGNWLTTLNDMEKSRQKELCKSILRAKFFIFTQLDEITYSELLKRDQWLLSNEIQVEEYDILLDSERVPILLCSLGELISIRLAHYSKQEGYILFSNSYRPVGVITKSYKFEEGTKLMKFVTAEILRRSLLYSDALNSKLPLYSLDQFNQQKLCATLMHDTLEHYVLLEDTFPERTRNVLLSTDFEHIEFDHLKLSSLKCMLDKSTKLHISQMPYFKYHVIVFLNMNQSSFNMYKITEFKP